MATIPIFHYRDYTTAHYGVNYQPEVRIDVVINGFKAAGTGPTGQAKTGPLFSELG